MLKKLLSLLSLIQYSYSQICQLIIPPLPLTYNGLITPYQLSPPCDMKIAPSFVEAVILDLDTNSLSVYHPLVINAGTTPLVPPVTFNMPKNSLVGIWFGSNAVSISLSPLTSIQQGQCIYNIGGITSQDTFGQFAHCNAISFFQKIKELILNKIPLNPPIPDLGFASDGEPCLTTRDFALVDMDPSDNVVTTYLIDMATGKTAQNTFNNQNVNPQTVILKNGSDNLLLSNLDIIMGCKPYQVPNIVDQNNPLNSKISSMALDEIHAAVNQKKFYAYIPKGDPMVRINNMPSLSKLNAYRQGIFQPVVNDLKMADTTYFCAHMTNIQLPRLLKNKQNFILQPSPDQAIATNLYGFLLNRFSTSYTGLNCNILLDIQNPITLILNNNQLVTDGTIALIPTIETSANDPYLLSWDEYPEFNTPVPTTPVPTTPVPTTPVPTTPVPTTPVPTTPVPTTPIPTTPVPTTPVPTTPVPTTPVPTTPVPTTPVPTTPVPTTPVPTTPFPTTPVPTTPFPTTPVPTTPFPTTPVPTTRIPTTSVPTHLPTTPAATIESKSSLSITLIILLSSIGLGVLSYLYYCFRRSSNNVNNVNNLNNDSNSTQYVDLENNKSVKLISINKRGISPVRIKK
jgi:hypothetical protein